MCKSSILFVLAVAAACHGPGAKVVADDPLIDAATLHQWQSKPNIRIVEVVHDETSFGKGHLPRAVAMDWLEDLTDSAKRDRYTKPSKIRIESLLGELGVDATTRVVFYDDLGSRLSTRAFWTLKVYGHQNVSVLDGGKSAWTRAGFELSTDSLHVEPRTYRACAANKAIEVRAADVLERLSDRKTSIIDGRPGKQYSGEEPGAVFHTKTIHQRRGHIPGAINITWTDNFNEDGTFKSKAVLRRMYAERGVTPDKAVITYCNEGIHAAPPWFVLKELLQFDDVRLYDDSMAEWANTDEFPLRLKTD
jgi:thiosulfate/3-mercaptopyruvate sulfurtransferase